MPGAVTSVAYGCFSLAAQGDLAAVVYEFYIIPTAVEATQSLNRLYGSLANDPEVETRIGKPELFT